MAVPKKAVVPVLVLLVAAAAGAGAFYALRRGGAAEGVVRVSGNIEVTDAEVSFKIPGRVEKRWVDEGQRVNKGDPIAMLDRKDLETEVEMRRAELAMAKAAEQEMQGSRPDEVKAAQAAFRKAEAALADLQKGYRPEEIAAAEAAKKQAQTEYERTERDFGRAASLYKDKVIAHEEYDRANSAFRVAEQRLVEATERYEMLTRGFRVHQVEQAKSARDQAEAEYNLVYEGPRKEKRDQAKAKREQAEAALRLAEIRYQYADLRSPLSGIVLSKNIEEGEYVAPGTPVVTVGDLENVWLRAYINQTDVGRVKPGQKAVVRTDTYPDREYQGYVAFISQEAEFTPKSVQTPKERVKLVYRVKINVDKNENPNMELLPGMPADAEIVVE